MCLSLQTHQPIPKKMRQTSKRARLQAASKAVEELPVAEGMPALAEEIRNSILEQSFSQKRCKFIDAQLRKMSEEELVRFEFFVRSHFPRPTVKKILQDEVDKSVDQTRQARSAWGGSAGGMPEQPFVTDDMAIIVAGLGKLLVGELVSAAMEIAREQSQARAQVADALALAEAGVGVDAVGAEGLEGSGSPRQRSAALSSRSERAKITPESMEAAVMRLQQEGKLGLGTSQHGPDFLFSRQGCLGAKIPSQGIMDAFFGTDLDIASYMAEDAVGERAVARGGGDGGGEGGKGGLLGEGKG